MTRHAAQAALGLDLGGTKILGLLVSPSGEVLSRHSRPTPRDSADALIDALASGARMLLAEAERRGLEVTGAGVGAPGPLDPEVGVISEMPNLPGRDLPLAARLGEALDIPVRLENDANAALLGEAAFGAGRGARDQLMLTLGTGVGGALICGGALVHGASGAAGELGHITVEAAGRPCGCGRRGCLETVASGVAVAAIAAEDWRMPDITTAEVLSRWDARSEQAQPLLERATRGLASALSMLVNTLNPGLIILGGGFGVAAYEHLAPRLEAALPLGCFPIAARALRLSKAALGPDAGALGAASLFLSARPEPGAPA